jgi:uncharacterized membrane protein YbhN (UPF0104 family)
VLGFLLSIPTMTPNVAAVWQAVVAAVERVSTARPGYVLAVLGLYVISLFIVGARWRGFLRAVGGEVGVGRATLATLGGISVGNLTPSSRLGGEAMRIALVRLSGRVTWRQGTIAVIWDRLSEVPSVAVLAVMATFAVHDLSSRWRTAALVTGLAAVLVAVGLGLRHIRASGTTPAGWRERLALDRIRLSVFSSGVGLSALLWLQDVCRLWCAAMAFGVMLSPTRVAVLAVLTVLGSLVPTVGGLGAVEGGLVAGLVAFGVGFPTAAAITAAERLVSYGFGTAAGGLVVALLGGRSLWTTARSRQTPADELVP